MARKESNPEPEGLSFPVVGIGASAGGLEAFTRLLRALPDDTGLAFVLVQHLAPARESALAAILSRATSMPVTEVADESEVAPNHVYVIPPDRNMTMVRGHLKLVAREARGLNRPVDQFFRSLAENQRHLAIGVVLSGTATDGTLGLEAIKAEGGITFAQDDTAQYDGMPRSAAHSGCADFVLSPEGIANEITRIASHPLVAPQQDAAETIRDDRLDKAALAPILRLLHAATGVDFTHYKSGTLCRRITRRMVLLREQGVEAYAQFLRENAGEMEALYQDILINVTSFFRDPEVFEAIKTSVIPALLAQRLRQEPFRAWVLGCSTGEEAYSHEPPFLRTDLRDRPQCRGGRACPCGCLPQGALGERLARALAPVLRGSGRQLPCRQADP
jgi:two-component system CheB/CheR fusion protein